MALSAVPGWGVKLQGEQQVEDEFTCPGVLRGSLLDLKNTLERVFRVILNIGGEDEAYTTQDKLIWLQLKGRKGEVEAAKLFVKGIVNQETQKEVQYPDTLHCVFCGARGLFVDCLVRITSAHIVLGSMGSLLISGLVEPVVKACSLIVDLVDKYRNRQAPVNDGAGESLDSRRAFKSLVEGLEDSHTLDLLVLPVMVKEVLLDLVKQSGVDPSTLDSASERSKTLLELHEKMDRLMQRQSTDSRTSDILGNSTFPFKQNGTLKSYTLPPELSSKSHSCLIKDQEDQPGEEPSLRGASRDDFFHVAEETPRVHAEGIEGRTEVGDVQRLFQGVPQETEEQQESEQQEENLMSAGSKQEHEHLLKFFTAMGYDEQVVCRVLTRTGPKEASQLLDLIQQEQDKSGIQLEHSNARVSDQEALPGATSEASVGVNGASSTIEDDFVLGVVKKAAASCGYTEEKVIEVYSNLPELTPHELIVELQKRRDLENDMRNRAEEMEEQQRKATALQKASERDVREERRIDRKSEATKVEKPESDRVTGLREISNKKEGVQVGGRETISLEPSIREPFVQMDALDWARKPEHPSTFQNQPRQIIPPAVRGPPQPTYPLPLYPNFSEQQINAPTGQPATRPKHTQGPPANKSGAVVTGPQRFLESLEKPFALQLRNDPGDSGLRQIIIDGSNVAMSHGLGTFFSCRGIALAVQYFWNRGHRDIAVFVPQWRQKINGKIKEPHFMAQLQNLGLLSFTPSREVSGQRINSYDDRIMLQCAQQTNGVIVTNDNMRDLVDESVAWKEIIKKRLLQYLFAGDMFMVPDDPLGRSGPHLNDFLRNQNSLPAPGSHSFAGVPSSFSLPAPPPRANTEVLQYRERTPGGRPQKTGKGPPKFERKGNRSAEETLRLKQDLVQIFPGQDSVVMMALQCHPTVTDINDLSSFILEQQEDEQE